VRVCTGPVGHVTTWASSLSAIYRPSGSSKRKTRPKYRELSSLRGPHPRAPSPILGWIDEPTIGAVHPYATSQRASARRFDREAYVNGSLCRQAGGTATLERAPAGAHTFCPRGMMISIPTPRGPGRNEYALHRRTQLVLRTSSRAAFTPGPGHGRRAGFRKSARGSWGTSVRDTIRAGNFTRTLGAPRPSLAPQTGIGSRADMDVGDEGEMHAQPSGTATGTESSIFAV
jgi:hypothetical protein